jgi:hypothetical protein
VTELSPISNKPLFLDAKIDECNLLEIAVTSGNTQMVNLMKTNLEYFVEIVNRKVEVSKL